MIVKKLSSVRKMYVISCKTFAEKSFSIRREYNKSGSPNNWESRQLEDKGPLGRVDFCCKKGEEVVE